MPRCCFQRLTFRRGLAMRILSVRLTNAYILTKRKKDLSRFLYHTKEHLAQFSEKKNGLVGATPSTWNSGSTGPRWSEIACSASAVTPSEKKFINTNRKSTTRFPISLKWSTYVTTWPLSPPPKGWLENAMCSRCEQQAAITPTRYEIGCLLITNRKSHAGFRLVPTSMILNDLERRNSPHFAFFHRIRDFQADYITVVEDRPIMSVKYCFPVPVFRFWPRL